jgi:hypothetical protein
MPDQHSLSRTRQTICRTEKRKVACIPLGRKEWQKILILSNYQPFFEIFGGQLFQANHACRNIYTERF